ncbi:MAG: chromosome segregation protein [Podoviridae sp. ctDWo9]|nr:MAG: chromosome segregation protein [Podoviridae sp. ctDWo9]
MTTPVQPGDQTQQELLKRLAAMKVARNTPSPWVKQQAAANKQFALDNPAPQEPTGLKGAAIDALMSPVGQATAKALDTAFGRPQRTVLSGAREAWHAIDMNDATKSSVSDYESQVNDPVFGFGSLEPIKAIGAKHKWTGRMIGFAGDVLTDPLTYLTAGGSAYTQSLLFGGKAATKTVARLSSRYAAKKAAQATARRTAAAALLRSGAEQSVKDLAQAGAKQMTIREFVGTKRMTDFSGRLLLAEAVKKFGASADEVALVAARGVGSVPPDIAKAMGLNRAGLYMFGVRVPGFRIPGTAAVGGMMQSVGTASRIAFMGTGMGVGLSHFMTRGGGIPVIGDFAKIKADYAAGRTLPADRALHHAWLMSEMPVRSAGKESGAFYNEAATRVTQHPSFSKHDGDIAGYVETADWRTLTPEQAEAAGLFQDMLDAARIDMEARFGVTEPGFKIVAPGGTNPVTGRPRYVPHITTTEYNEYASRHLNNPFIQLIARETSNQVLDAKNNLAPRYFKVGDDFLGQPGTKIKYGTIEELNRLWRATTKLKFDLFETKASRILAGYKNTVVGGAQVAKFMEELLKHGDGAIKKFSEVAEVDPTLLKVLQEAHKLASDRMSSTTRDLNNAVKKLIKTVTELDESSVSIGTAKGVAESAEVGAEKIIASLSKERAASTAAAVKAAEAKYAEATKAVAAARKSSETTAGVAASTKASGTATAEDISRVDKVSADAEEALRVAAKAEGDALRELSEARRAAKTSADALAGPGAKTVDTAVKADAKKRVDDATREMQENAARFHEALGSFKSMSDEKSLVLKLVHGAIDSAVSALDDVNKSIGSRVDKIELLKNALVNVESLSRTLEAINSFAETAPAAIEAVLRATYGGELDSATLARIQSDMRMGLFSGDMQTNRIISTLLMPIGPDDLEDIAEGGSKHLIADSANLGVHWLNDAISSKGPVSDVLNSIVDLGAAGTKAERATMARRNSTRRMTFKEAEEAVIRAATVGDNAAEAADAVFFLTAKNLKTVWHAAGGGEAGKIAARGLAEELLAGETPRASAWHKAVAATKGMADREQRLLVMGSKTLSAPTEALSPAEARKTKKAWGARVDEITKGLHVRAGRALGEYARNKRITLDVRAERVTDKKSALTFIAVLEDYVKTVFRERVFARSQISKRMARHVDGMRYDDPVEGANAVADALIGFIDEASTKTLPTIEAMEERVLKFLVNQEYSDAQRARFDSAMALRSDEVRRAISDAGPEYGLEESLNKVLASVRNLRMQIENMSDESVKDAAEQWAMNVAEDVDEQIRWSFVPRRDMAELRAAQRGSTTTPVAAVPSQDPFISVPRTHGDVSGQKDLLDYYVQQWASNSLDSIVGLMPDGLPTQALFGVAQEGARRNIVASLRPLLRTADDVEGIWKDIAQRLAKVHPSERAEALRDIVGSLTTEQQETIGTVLGDITWVNRSVLINRSPEQIRRSLPEFVAVRDAIWSIIHGPGWRDRSSYPTGTPVRYGPDGELAHAYTSVGGVRPFLDDAPYIVSGDVTPDQGWAGQALAANKDARRRIAALENTTPKALHDAVLQAHADGKIITPTRDRLLNDLDAAEVKVAEINKSNKAARAATGVSNRRAAARRARGSGPDDGAVGLARQFNESVRLNNSGTTLSPRRIREFMKAVLGTRGEQKTGLRALHLEEEEFVKQSTQIVQGAEKNRAQSLGYLRNRLYLDRGADGWQYKHLEEAEDLVRQRREAVARLESTSAERAPLREAKRDLKEAEKEYAALVAEYEKASPKAKKLLDKRAAEKMEEYVALQVDREFWEELAESGLVDRREVDELFDEMQATLDDKWDYVKKAPKEGGDDVIEAFRIRAMAAKQDDEIFGLNSEINRLFAEKESLWGERTELTKMGGPHSQADASRLESVDGRLAEIGKRTDALWASVSEKGKVRSRLKGKLDAHSGIFKDQQAREMALLAAEQYARVRAGVHGRLREMRREAVTTKVGLDTPMPDAGAIGNFRRSIFENIHSLSQSDIIHSINKPGTVGRFRDVDKQFKYVDLLRDFVRDLETAAAAREQAQKNFSEVRAGVLATPVGEGEGSKRIAVEAAMLADEVASNPGLLKVVQAGIDLASGDPDTAMEAFRVLNALGKTKNIPQKLKEQLTELHLNATISRDFEASPGYGAAKQRNFLNDALRLLAQVDFRRLDDEALKRFLAIFRDELGVDVYGNEFDSIFQKSRTFKDLTIKQNLERKMALSKEIELLQKNGKRSKQTNAKMAEMANEILDIDEKIANFSGARQMKYVKAVSSLLELYRTSAGMSDEEVLEGLKQVVDGLPKVEKNVRTGRTTKLKRMFDESDEGTALAEYNAAQLRVMLGVKSLKDMLEGGGENTLGPILYGRIRKAREMLAGAEAAERATVARARAETGSESVDVIGRGAAAAEERAIGASAEAMRKQMQREISPAIRAAKKEVEVARHANAPINRRIRYQERILAKMVAEAKEIDEYVNGLRTAISDDGVLPARMHQEGVLESSLLAAYKRLRGHGSGESRVPGLEEMIRAKRIEIGQLYKAGEAAAKAANAARSNLDKVNARYREVNELLGRAADARGVVKRGEILRDGLRELKRIKKEGEAKKLSKTDLAKAKAGDELPEGFLDEATELADGVDEFVSILRKFGDGIDEFRKGGAERIDETANRMELVAGDYLDAVQARIGAVLHHEAAAAKVDAATKVRGAKDITDMFGPGTAMVYKKVIDDGMEMLTAKGAMGNLNLQATPEAAALLGNMARLTEPTFVRAVNAWVGPYTRSFVTYALLTPGFHFRNVQNNIFSMLASGGNPVTMLKGVKEWKALHAALEGGMSIDDYVASLPAKRAARVRDSYRAMLGSGGGQYSELPFDTGGRIVNNPITRFSRKVGVTAEEYSRFVLAFDAISKGDSVAGAQNHVRRFLIDYEDVSKFDKYMESVIPFWKFMSRNLPLHARNRIENPKYYAMYGHFQDNFEDENGSVTLPDWMRQAGAFMLPGRNWAATPDFGFTRMETDVRQLENPQKLLSHINPAFRVPLELLSGRSFHRGEKFSAKQIPVDGPVGLLAALLGKPVGLSGTSPEGETTVNDALMYALQALVPTANQAERFMPSEEYYKQRGNLNPLLGMLGVPVRRVTPAMLEAERRRVQREVDKRRNG